MEELENKYIDLILKRCLNFEDVKSLLIHSDLKEHQSFAEKVKKRANELGIFDVSININDMYEIHDYLKNTSVEDIVLNPIIDRGIWDTYAIKGGNILFISSVLPGLMNDIPTEKIQKWVSEREKDIPYYRANVSRYAFPWCIAAMPNERWAKTIFKNDENAEEKLFMMIMKMCMVDQVDPIAAWDNYLKENNRVKNKLNSLNITSLHYKNLNTDFTVGLPKDIRWFNIDKGLPNVKKVMNNLPSYEIFTTPDYRTANGIVYSSKPLFYNETIIDDFYLVFKNGQVVECHAKKGEEMLRELVFENEGANYLGEVALVPIDSPISNTGLVFNCTLFDENASPHAALGRGFAPCFPGYENMTNEELKKLGMNVSKKHVDFMIGTADLDITATTNEGEKLIFKKGKFNL